MGFKAIKCDQKQSTLSFYFVNKNSQGVAHSPEWLAITGILIVGTFTRINK